MEEIKEIKQQICDDVTNKLKLLTKNTLNEMIKALELKLFQFANFMESKIVLLYINSKNDVPTKSIINKAHDHGKIVVLPIFHKDNFETKLIKIDNPLKDLVKSSKGIIQLSKNACKAVPIECVDIAIIPGISMDEKGGRIGSGNGYYDKIIPNLPITTRKVGLVFEEQIVPIIPMESHNKHVDIIVTEKRIIYKI